MSMMAQATIELHPATAKQTAYACLRYHYAHSVPSIQAGFAVFENDSFIGIVGYGGGANYRMAGEFGLLQGQVMELVRVALTTHKTPTSRIVAMSLKALKKRKPLVKLVVSYADFNQGHLGIIYQASNWLYMGKSESDAQVDPEDGKVKHKKTIATKYGTNAGFTTVKALPKHKYIYCFDKKLELEFKQKALAYPKQ